MSTRFRHLRLVRPWLSVVRQYCGQPESPQLRWGSDRVSKLLGCEADCLGLATWACPAAQQTLKPYIGITAAVRYLVLLDAELAGLHMSNFKSRRDSRFDQSALWEEGVAKLPTNTQGSRLYFSGRQETSRQVISPKCCDVCIRAFSCHLFSRS